MISAEGRPDVLFDEGNGAKCDLSEDAILQHEGRFYKFEGRLVFLENTIENPSDDWVVDTRLCVKRNYLNADGCKVQPESTAICGLVCGSPGEIASDPLYGNQVTV